MLIALLLGGRSHLAAYMCPPNPPSLQAKQTTLQYRFGQLPNNKLLYRYGISKTELCPLCHTHQDGGHHIASECPPFLEN